LQAVVWEPLPSFVFGVFATISCLLYVFLPETLGQTLWDTIEEAEQHERISSKKARCVNLIYAMSGKKFAEFCPQLQQILSDFPNSFAITLSAKFVMCDKKRKNLSRKERINACIGGF